ncbi:MAG: hypothetical protein AAB893_04340 [Patescibacteria group bacterium]
MDIVQTMRRFGTTYYFAGKLELAAAMLSEAGHSADLMNLREDLVKTNHYLGLIAIGQESYLKAEDYLIRACRIQQNIINEMSDELRKIYLSNPARKRVFENTIAYYKKQKEPVPEETTDSYKQF